VEGEKNSRLPSDRNVNLIIQRDGGDDNAPNISVSSLFGILSIYTHAYREQLISWRCVFLYVENSDHEGKTGRRRERFALGVVEYQTRLPMK
jgi:hypothetical protein